MAHESIGRRSIRTVFEHAGGDNHLYMSKRRETSYEENFLNVEMAERATVSGRPDLHERRYFGGLFGNKELVLMSFVTVALYLINGEHAQLVCTALTSVPPALFSYRVLMSQQTSKEGYHSILFYWTLYGLVALADQFVGSAQGYHLCKGGLLGFVFLHAVRSNLSVIPRSWFLLDQPTVDMLTSIFSRIESDTGFVPRTPTATQFSDEDLELMFSEDSTLQNDAMEVSTACSFQPSIEMQSTQNVSPEFQYKTATPKTMKVEEETAKDPSSTIRIRPQFQTMSAMTTTGGSPADIVTLPSEFITFSPGNRETLIQVTNVSPLHVMFALKTNADTYLIAAPTAGILFSGQTIKMRVGVTEEFFEDCEDPGMTIDKLAIDYTTIPPQYSSSILKFSPQFFQSQNRRRHAIRVFYE